MHKIKKAISAYIFSRIWNADSCWHRSSLNSVANIRDLCWPTVANKRRNHHTSLGQATSEWQVESQHKATQIGRNRQQAEKGRQRDTNTVSRNSSHRDGQQTHHVTCDPPPHTHTHTQHAQRQTTVSENNFQFPPMPHPAKSQHLFQRSKQFNPGSSTGHSCESNCIQVVRTCSFKFKIFSVNSEQPVVQIRRTNLQTREWCRSGRSWEQSVFHLQRWWFCTTTHCNVELLQWTSCGNPVLWHSMPAICKHIVKCGVIWRTKWRRKI